MRILDTPEDVSRAAAEHFVSVAGKTLAAGAPFSVALSGGSTPRRVYQLLASDVYRSRVDWSNIHLFFGDERCVSASDPASNYHMAYETLISHLAIPAENVHPIKGEGDPAANAQAYELELKKHFADLDWPRFDFVFLGLGEDGHTASLFPQTAALKEERSWVVANWVEKLDSFRITLTAPAINHGSEIMFIATGKEKARTLQAVLQGPKNPELYPAQLVQPEIGSLILLVDKDASRKLDQM